MSYTRQVKSEDKEFNLKKPLIMAVIFIIISAFIFSIIKTYSASISLAVKDFFRVDQREAIVLGTDENIAPTERQSFFENLPLFRFFIKSGTNETIEVTATETNSKLETSIRETKDEMFKNFTNTSRITREALSPFFNNNSIVIGNKETTDEYSKKNNENEENNLNLNKIETKKKESVNDTKRDTDKTIEQTIKSALNESKSTNFTKQSESITKTYPKTNEMRTSKENNPLSSSPFYGILKPKTSPPVTKTMKPAHTTSYGISNTGSYKNEDTASKDEIKENLNIKTKKETIKPEVSIKSTKKEDYKSSVRVVRTPDIKKNNEDKKTNDTNIDNYAEYNDTENKVKQKINQNAINITPNEKSDDSIKLNTKTETANIENTEKKEYKDIVSSTSHTIISSAANTKITTNEGILNNENRAKNYNDINNATLNEREKNEKDIMTSTSDIILRSLTNTNTLNNTIVRNYEDINNTEIDEREKNEYKSIITSASHSVLSSITNMQDKTLNRVNDIPTVKNIREDPTINEIVRNQTNSLDDKENNIVREVPTNVTKSLETENKVIDSTGIYPSENQTPSYIVSKSTSYPQRENYRERGIYLVEYDENLGTITLIFRNRNLGKNPTLEDAILSLLKGATDDENRKNIISAIPKTTKLLDIFREKDTVYLNFSGEFEFNPLGDEGMLVQLYQLVYTATQFDGINKVVFLIDGSINETIGAEGSIENTPFTRLERDKSILNVGN